VAAQLRALVLERIRIVRTALEEGLKDEPQSAQVFDFIRGEAGNRIVPREGEPEPSGEMTWRV
jgi:hypothetical protein